MKISANLFLLKPKYLVRLVALLVVFGVFLNFKLEAIAQERVFLDLSLEFLDQYELPPQEFQNTPVGGLSGISYDRLKDRFYVVSDDRSGLAPARFYTLKINLEQGSAAGAKIKEIVLENVTFLQDEGGQTYPQGAIDPEGIAVSPRGTVFIASEGDRERSINPFIAEYDFNGKLKQQLRIPQRYLLEGEGGVQNNLAFEPLAIKANGTVAADPFRLFTATEEALKQDVNPDNPQTRTRSRFLHYLINSIGEPILVAEHLYPIDLPAAGAIYNGITELLALEREGYLLSLERTFGLGGAGAKIFQVVVNDATDTSTFASLAGDIEGVIPLKKKILLDLQSLGIPLGNLEAMTFGPTLADGSQTLILVSDNNFSPQQKNQFLLFKFNYN